MFTDIGIIYQYKLHYSRMNYSDFTSSIICMNSKLEASDVIITMKSGEKITLHVCGGNGKFRDVFEFGRFVSRVIEDQTKAINGVTIKKWTK